MDANERFIPADELASQMGTGVDPANTALMQALAQIQQIQARPLIPDDPFAQLGAGLEGLGAGFRGQVNPAVRQALAVREQQIGALGQQANIASAINQMRMHQLQLEETRRARTTAEKREKNEEERILLERQKLSKQVALDTYNALGSHPDQGMREHAYRGLQEVGILPKSADVSKMAVFPKGQFDKLHDQVLDIVRATGDPSAPFDQTRFGTMFPKDTFGPIAIAGQQALRTGGVVALNAMKIKPETAETALKARHVQLGSIDPGLLTPEQRREKEAIATTLKLQPENQSMIERWAAKLKEEDRLAGRPPKLESVYLDMANDMSRDRTSSLRDIHDEAKRRGLKQGTAEWYQFVSGETLRLAGARAEAVQDATRLPEKERGMLNVLIEGKTVLGMLLNQFTPQERARYAGWLNFKGRALAQAINADPRFAQFRAQVNKGKSMAFSDGGKNLTQFEGGITFGWVPTGEELSAVDFEEKLKFAYDSTERTAARIVNLSTRPSSEIAKEYTERAKQPPPPPVGAGRFEEIKDPSGKPVLDAKGRPKLRYVPQASESLVPR